MASWSGGLGVFVHTAAWAARAILFVRLWKCRVALRGAASFQGVVPVQPIYIATLAGALFPAMTLVALCVWCRIRNPDMSPCEGVTIMDMGHKIGCNGVDNGQLRFNHYVAPRCAESEASRQAQNCRTLVGSWRSPAFTLRLSTYLLTRACMGVCMIDVGSHSSQLNGLGLRSRRTADLSGALSGV